MSEFNKKNHWETVYNTKDFNQTSWYQEKPITSLEQIESLGLPKSAKIIDVGGGDSYLVDFLLELGYQNITVLDISEKAIERAKERLADKAKLVTWIVADASNFDSNTQYDIWHDRAAFHFLTDINDIANYKTIIQDKVSLGGFALLSTFSENGPTKCSGIPIKQYSKEELSTQFQSYFETVSCSNLNHKTPFDTIQNFTSCIFKRK